jgi:thioredoxin-related protein
MGAVTYPNATVQEFIASSFIPVKIGTGESPELWSRYSANWTPTILVLDSNGNEKHRIVGYLDPDHFLGQLCLGVGKFLMEAEKYEESIRSFSEVVKQYPNTEAAPEAAYYDAVTRYKQTHDPGHLKAGFKQLQEKYPGNEWTRKASVWA